MWSNGSSSKSFKILPSNWNCLNQVISQLHRYQLDSDQPRELYINPSSPLVLSFNSNKMQHNSKNWFRIRKNEHCECQFSAVWLAEKHHQYSPCLYFYPRTLTDFSVLYSPKDWGWGVRLHRPIEIKVDYYDPFSDVIIFSRFCILEE